MASLQETFRLDFMQHALLAGLLVGAVCGYLSVYVVLKRIVFVGIALAEMSSAGIALALWLGGILGLAMEEHNHLTTVGAVALMLLGVLLFSIPWSRRRIPPESTIGIGYAVAAAGALVLMARSATGEAHMMDLLFGNILTVSVCDIATFAGVGSLVLLVHLLFAKEFLFTSFDPETASTLGYQPRRWEVLFYLTLGVTIAFAIRLVGVLLVFALLILPAVTALLLTRRLGRAFPVSVACGVLPTAVGLYLSYVADLPSGACIVLLSFALLTLCGGVALVRRA